MVHGLWVVELISAVNEIIRGMSKRTPTNLGNRFSTRFITDERWLSFFLSYAEEAFWESQGRALCFGQPPFSSILPFVKNLRRHTPSSRVETDSISCQNCENFSLRFLTSRGRPSIDHGENASKMGYSRKIKYLAMRKRNLYRPDYHFWTSSSEILAGDSDINTS